MSTTPRVKIWGCRGSIPTPLSSASVRSKVKRALAAAEGRVFGSSEAIDAFMDELPFDVCHTYGGNTSCVEVQLGSPDDYLICDAGSGLRSFSEEFMKSGRAQKPATFHILMSHFHWDHIQGLPFFVPAYIPGNRIIFHGFHDEMERLFRAQMDDLWFPIDFSSFNAEIVFEHLSEEDVLEIGPFVISFMEQNHPGKSYGFRFEGPGGCFVYSTDCEHKIGDATVSNPFVSFYSGADTLIFDAQYTLEDNIVSKQNWGHSNSVVAVDLALLSRVKYLVIFHHEPTNSDEVLTDYLQRTCAYCEATQVRMRNEGKLTEPLRISLAFDGMEIGI